MKENRNALILANTQKFLLAFGLAIALGGCVSIDPRALREEAHADSDRLIVGTFKNYPSYRSRGEFVASATLSDALGIGRRGATSVTVTRPSATELKLVFDYPEGEPTVSAFSTGSGLNIKEGGKFDIALRSECGGRDSPGFGCGSKRVTLFVNTAGELTAIETGGGAGLLGIIPFALYAQKIATFSRIQ